MNRWFVAWVIGSCAGLAGAAPASPSAPTLGCLIEPDRVADLGSPVIGVLEGLRVDRGDVIRKGQVLAVLRSDVERATAEVARTRAMAEADLHSAEANRDFARQKLKRAEDLVARNFLAQQALDQARTELQARFAQHGIAATRLQLEERDSRWQYLRYHQIDIALDPFPANGGTSSCDVLWMGVPLVTLAGTRFVSRMGVSLLYAVGHPEWVAQDQADYLDIAARLAADIPALNAIRLALRAEMEASQLMDEAGFTRQFEAALRGMWQAWCTQQAELLQPDQADEAKTGG